MAIFQSMFSFFLPSRRRPIPTPPYAPQAAPVVEGLNEAFAAIDELSLPNQIAENFKKDLTDSLDIATPSTSYQGAYPGNIAKLSFNLSKIFRDPVAGTVGVLRDYVGKYGSDLTKYIDPNYYNSRILGPVLKQFRDPRTGAYILPVSTRFRLEDWGVAAGAARGARLAVEENLWDDPGLISLWAGELGGANPGLAINGVSVADIITEAGASRRILDSLHLQKFKAASSGDWNLADQLSDRIKDELRGFKQRLELRGVSPSDVTREFEFLVKSNPNISTEATRLYRTLNNQHIYYGVFDFLKAWKKGGIPEVAREYVWKAAIKNIFKKGTFREYLYPPNLIKEGIKRVFGKPMDQLAKLIRSQVAKFRDQLIKAASRLGPVIRSLLKKVFTAIGSLSVSVSGPFGPVIAAALNFIISEVIFKAIGGTIKILAYTVGGIIAFFIIFGVAVAVFLSVILANIPYPWEAVATELDCDTSATATASCFPKSLVQQIADSWGVGPGNQVEACYSDVVAKSNEAGVDPGIALATWLHESNASNYELYARLGEPPQDFGIPSLAGQGFTAQIASFFNLYNSFYPSEFASCYTGHSEMEGFFRAFSTAGREEFGVGQCPDLTPEGERTVQEYIKTYNDISVCN